jgi:benzoyl-CoA reductase/2-hydroxyglutaryl-CoA dehydratase subunit BcrC/BadD/HgdB
MADTYLSSVLCSYPRSLLERALDLGFSQVDGWVFVASCDHVRRLYDNLVYLQEPAFHCFLDLPHKRDDHAIAWYAEELRRLAQRLSQHFDVRMDDEAIRESIGLHNEHLGRVRVLDASRCEDPPGITGADFHRVLMASSTVPKDALVSAFQQILRDGSGPSRARPRARVMVLGSALDDPAYLSVIESVGAAVVADRFCFGGMPGLEDVVCEDDPIRGMAAQALRTAQCPRMMGGFDERMGYVLDKVRQRRVDGVLLSTMKFCDLWGVEGSLMAAALREAGVAVLRLEREVALGGEGQLRTRVQAFLEALGR